MSQADHHRLAAGWTDYHNIPRADAQAQTNHVHVRYHNGSHLWLSDGGHNHKSAFNSLQLGKKDPNREWTSNVTFTRSDHCPHCKKDSRILEAKGQRAAWYRCCGRPA